MAKKKKKEEKEDKYEFKLPEFDEKEFLLKEIRDAKATFVAVLFGVIIAFLSLLLTMIKWEVAFAVGVLSTFGLKFVLMAFHINTDDFEKKNWLGVGAAYFFTWLAVWVLLINPPLIDLAPPQISELNVYVDDNGNYTRVIDTVNADAIIIINATVVDNAGLDSVKLFLNNEPKPYTEKRGHTYTFRVGKLDEGRYKVKIVAKDVNGHESSKVKEFTVLGK